MSWPFWGQGVIGAELVHQVNVMSGVGMSAYPGKMAPVGDIVGGLNRGTLEAVLPALALKLFLYYFATPLTPASFSSPEPRAP